MLEVSAGNPSTAVRRPPSSRPKSRPLGAVGLETRLRAQPLAREAMAQSAGDGWFGAVGVERAGAQCAPLHTVCRQARRHLRHRASEMTIKLRGQVVARLAERQRRFIIGLKTGGWSQDTFVCARTTAAALGRQDWASTGLSRGLSLIHI